MTIISVYEKLLIYTSYNSDENKEECTQNMRYTIIKIHIKNST